ncbi:EVE domain-containing protein [Ideonella sp. BN130291]|uniref:EVE domain-containing protein n=1 Tax=Ideonella sp. BN130291 TaxID=3112940 RepID=UPI002E2749F8|nr:EVE domain-containing protein [Ideonella sp. BN130291]
MSAPRCWIAVASAEHVRRGRAEGFMQVCHGKCAPLKRVQPGDRVAYYSPSERFRGTDRLQAFTAAGIVQPGEPYAFDMGEGFMPFRRNVQWFSQRVAPIAPLLPRLAFAAGPGSWGYKLRFGLFDVSAEDMDLIFEATASAPPAQLRFAA